MSKIIHYIQNTFSEVGNITSFVTLSATVLGAFSLLLSNLARYFQANKFGIPIKAIQQANVGDSIGIWITLVGTLGLGVFVPILLLNVEAGWWFVYITMIVSCFFGLFISKCYVIAGKDKEKEFNGEVFVHETDVTELRLATISPIFAVAYMHVRSMFYHVYIVGCDTAFAEGFFAYLRLYASFFALGVYALMIIFPLFFNIKDKLSGGREKMVTEIDGQTYLVAMRNSQYHWILIPCEPCEVVYKKLKSGGRIGSQYIRFEKGKFIICDMSHPPKEIRRLMDYNLVEKGVLKKAEKEK